MFGGGGGGLGSRPGSTGELGWGRGVGGGGSVLSDAG